MSDWLPAYYTSLGPFHAHFAGGLPILTYHKFGPPPRGARLRGLHLRRELFLRQCQELRQAGYETVSPGDSIQPSTKTRRIALTMDDGFSSVVEQALPILQSHSMSATLYLVADRLGGRNEWEIDQGELPALLMGPDEIRTWLSAGQRIGSHTNTHPWLTRLSPESAREEIRVSRLRLEDRFGVPVLDFCYPYGDWNPRLRDEVMDAGYRSATTTDFGVNPPGSDPFALRRITARHASRNWRFLWREFRRWWASDRPGGR